MIEPHILIDNYLASDRTQQHKTLRYWRNKVWDDDSAKKLMLGMAKHGLWKEVGGLWVNPCLRRVLWLIIDDLQRYADSQGNMKAMKSSVPAILFSKEWQHAFSYGIKAKNIEIIKIMIAKGARPPRNLVLELGGAYTITSEPFYRQAIQAFLTVFSWKEIYHSFREYHDWRDLIRRGLKEDDHAMLVVASTIMKHKEKIAFVNSELSPKEMDTVVRHMTFSRAVLAHAPAEFKKKYLLSELSI